jgi:L-lactate utilization protein LutB
MSTFLGVPIRRHPGPGPSPIRGTQSFPKSAKAELANPQLRANLAHATSTIRDKCALVVNEMPDWEALRDAGSAIKTGHDDPNSSLPYASSLCGAGYDVCPVKIDIPTILVELRA